MYERFTDRARKVVVQSEKEARHFNQEYIGTEHLLSTLLKESACGAANALADLGVDLQQVRLRSDSLISTGPEPIKFEGKLPSTPQFKKVIQDAFEEARALHHIWLGTEHILLGLLREQEGIPGPLLASFGVTLDDARRMVAKMTVDRELD